MNKILISIIDDNEIQRKLIIDNIPVKESLEFLHFAFPVEGMNNISPEWEASFADNEKSIGFIKYCKTESFFPDIALVDIDFSINNKDSQYLAVRDDYAKNGGESVLDFLFEFAKEKTIVIYLTGQGNKPQVDSLLSVSKKYHDAETIFIDKKDYTEITKKIFPVLQKVAKRYFKLLTPKQRTRLHNIIGLENNEEQILEYKLPFGKYIFQMKNLLVGWWNQETEQIENVKEIATQLLTETRRKYNFQGNWDLKKEKGEKGECVRHWQAYLEEGNQEKIDDINYAAFNFLLECIYRSKHENIKFFEELDSSLKIDPDFKVKVTSSLKSDLDTSDSKNWKIFRDKLIGRRVLLGWCDYYRGIESYGTLIGLLVYGTNEEYGIKAKKSSRYQHVYNTHLGLSKSLTRGEYKFDTSDGKLLPDEEIWLDKFVPLLKNAIQILEDFNKEDGVSFIYIRRNYSPEKPLNLNQLKSMVQNNSLYLDEGTLTELTDEFKEEYDQNPFSKSSLSKLLLF